jgi:glycerate kinase
VGVGGSATNDGGFGLARSLGWQFINRLGGEITAWPDLVDCAHISQPTHRVRVGRLTVALDVQNPLLGTKGCTRVFGPQKGLQTTDFLGAEAALRRMSLVIQHQHGNSAAKVAGSGAAGGLGFGLITFLSAKPMMGFSLFQREARLSPRVRASDLVITGEGCLDQQSLMGKGTGELLGLCERLRIPCVALNGASDLRQTALRRFVQVVSLTSLTRSEQALSRPGYWLGKAAELAAARLSTRSLTVG